MLICFNSLQPFSFTMLKVSQHKQDGAFHLAFESFAQKRIPSPFNGKWYLGNKVYRLGVNYKFTFAESVLKTRRESKRKKFYKQAECS
jgi:hypothetical protein